ncbi:MAG: hypothetical protein KAY37_13370 [Phycisphaerae bacterium]|nr:hypothetical protein [Phycisphaerae bacterium]
MQAPKMQFHAWGRNLIAAALLAAVVASAAGRTGNYLIIVPEGFNGTEPVTRIANVKTSQGFDVSTYVVPSGTSNSSIKSYIASLWGGPNAPDYILLVGDTSGSTSTEITIPHFSGGGSKHCTTDLPYACMDGGDDWYPDIAIGRFSASTLSELTAMVDKSLFVEAGVFSDPEYAKRGAFLANPSTCGMAEPTHDWVIDNYFTPNDYVGVKLYSSQGAGTSDVTNAVNNGCLWVGYYGHSGSTGWWDPSFGQGNVQALSNNGLYGVAWSFSCNVGNYSYDECFGETWLREANKGAAAVIFPSAYIYWGSQSEWEPSTVLEHSFFRAFFEDDIWEVGPAWQAGLYHFLVEYTGSTDYKRNFFELYNLLGDPSLLLPQPDGFSLEPTPLSQDLCCPPDDEAAYSIVVSQLGDFSEPVTLTASGEPAGATVDFSVNGLAPPFTSELTIGNLGGSAPDSYNIQIDGTSASIQRSTLVVLNISPAAPPTVTLTSPANGAVDVARMPTLTWQPAAQALEYDLEVATDAGFLNVVYSATVTDESHMVGIMLASDTLHYWHVRAVNGCGDNGFSPTFTFTTIDQPDYFTQLFTSGFDLDTLSLTFIPDGSGDYYYMCGSDISLLPTDPSGGTTLSLGDDDYGSVSPSSSVWLYGVAYNDFYVGSNGYITFGSGDTNYNESLAAHFDRPRLSLVFDDLNPSTGGTVSWKQTADRVAITWDDVPEYSSTGSNTFQVELYFDGTITLSWLQIDSNDSVVGLSQGMGMPADYIATDLSAAEPCSQPTGACCYLDGSCAVTTEAACTGAWQGQGTDCTPNICTQPGACCYPDGSCALATEVGGADCTGDYQGDDTVCDPNPCRCPGDSNCDTTRSWRDIDFFVAAMNDNVAAWEALFAPGSPSCPFLNNDVNNDGTVNWRDIDPFVALMNTPCP